MNGLFLKRSAPMAVLALTLAARAMSAGVVPAMFAPQAANPDWWNEQRLVPVCEAVRRADNGYVGALTDSLLATGGGDGVALQERAGPASTC